MTKPIEKTDWAVDPDALVTATDQNRWDFGWSTPSNNPSGIGEKPNLNQQNYWQNAVHNWIEYLKVSKTPLGSIVAVASDLTGAFDSATGVVTDGFQLCDGVAIAGGHLVTGNTPQLTDDRFLMGSTTAATGTPLGSNVNTHTHTIASHDHTMSHTHLWQHVSSSYEYKTYFSSTPASAGDIPPNQLNNAPVIYGSGTARRAIQPYDNNKHCYTGGVVSAPSGSGSFASTESVGLTTDNNTVTENRPRYIAVKYFIKVDV